ncbi:MAG: serine hydrolase [Aggregatilineales bacterium]
MTKLQEALMRLDLFTAQKMREQNIPAIQVGVTDDNQTLFLASDGVADVAAHLPLIGSHLFQIGSIGKSFTAIAILQEVEAGKLDLHAPVTAYLPWFDVRSQYEPITVHHLLTHSAGIIGGMDFTGEHLYEVYDLRETQTASAPGTYFHYSNVGYKALTLILETLNKQPYGDIIQERILNPLEMTQTLPVITHRARGLMAVGYTHYYDDRPAPPGRPLAPAPWFEYGYGDGSIVSNAEDMMRFMRMLIHGGQTDSGDRLISEEAFMQMVTPVVEAFGTHHYGYGLILSTFDEATHYGHGGSMPGFSAIMLVDADNRLGLIVLANHGEAEILSIAENGLKLLRAAVHEQDIPTVPIVAEPSLIENTADYTNTYTRDDGATLTFFAEGRRLYLQLKDADLQLFTYNKDHFVVAHPALSGDGFAFKRDESGQVVELFHGDAWYITPAYSGATRFDVPNAWHTYTGRYRAPNIWLPTFKVIIRKGQLLLVYPAGFTEMLINMGDHTFRPGTDEHSPERLHFDTFIDGKAARITFSGASYYRFFT